MTYTLGKRVKKRMELTDLFAAEQELLERLVDTEDRDVQSAIARRITRINKEMESLDN